MKAKPALLLLGAIACGLAAAWPGISFAFADDEVEIANWPAPFYWAPPTAPASQSPSPHGSRTSLTVSPTPMPFIALTPCRVADTRPGFGFSGAYGPPFMAGSVPRTFPIAGQCGIPMTAQAVSFNFTVTNTAGAGFLLAYPQGAPPPNVSTLNYLTSQTIANAALVPLGTGGGITAIPGVSGFDLIIDVNGYYAPETTLDTGGENTAYGFGVLYNKTSGGANTGFGYIALFSDTSGSYNSAFGSGALNLNTMGNYNSAFGYAALVLNTAGGYNSAFGYGALVNAAGSANSAFGTEALSRVNGDNNIGIGTNAGLNLTSGSNNIYIGADAGSASENNAIRIGTSQTSTYLAGVYGQTSATGVAVGINALGKLGTTPSSRRFKEEIESVGQESDALMRLRPVSFLYKPEYDETRTRQYGLVAEEVAEVAPSLVVYDKDGQPETVRYHFVNAMLLNEVQKQRRTLDALLNEAEEQRREIETLKRMLASFSWRSE